PPPPPPSFQQTPTTHNYTQINTLSLHDAFRFTNNNDRVKMLGNNTFGFEDMLGLGDKDYNDFVVSFDIA
ncbi:MAG: DUF4114 domain-containing protein, partial [Cyanobacteria bacterium J06597_16]